MEKMTKIKNVKSKTDVSFARSRRDISGLAWVLDPPFDSHNAAGLVMTGKYQVLTPLSVNKKFSLKGNLFLSFLTLSSSPVHVVVIWMGLLQ